MNSDEIFKYMWFHGTKDNHEFKIHPPSFDSPLYLTCSLIDALEHTKDKAILLFKYDSDRKLMKKFQYMIDSQDIKRQIKKEITKKQY